MGAIRLVTINTDASFSHQHKVGGYAYWIICDSGKLFSHGILKGEVKSSAQAELMAIVKALHHLKTSNWNKIQRIIINTDALYVIDYLSGTSLRPKTNQVLQPIAEYYHKQLTAEKFKDTAIELRHVKAHSGTNTARKFCNDWCDKAAKESMRQAVKSLPKINQDANGETAGIKKTEE